MLRKLHLIVGAAMVSTAALEPAFADAAESVRLAAAPRAPGIAAVVVLESCSSVEPVAVQALSLFDPQVLSAPVDQHGSVIGINEALSVTGSTMASLPPKLVTTAVAEVSDALEAADCKATIFSADYAVGSERGALPATADDRWGVVLKDLRPARALSYAEYMIAVEPIYRDFGFHSTGLLIDPQRTEVGDGVPGLPQADVLMSMQINAAGDTFDAYRRDPRRAVLHEMRQVSVAAYTNFVGRLIE